MYGVAVMVTLDDLDRRLARIEGLLLRLAPPADAPAAPAQAATVTPIRRAEIAMLARAAVSQKRGR